MTLASEGLRTSLSNWLKILIFNIGCEKIVKKQVKKRSTTLNRVIAEWKN